ncbi:MAG: hypothetical protein ACRBBK_07550 [Paracoccaceae bacterium]
MLKQNAFLIVTTCILASCGGVKSDDVTKALFSDVVVLSSDLSAITINGAPLSAPEYNAALDFGSLKNWHSADNTEQGYLGETTTGNSRAFVGVTNNAAVPFGNGTVMRVVPTALPTDGTATYLGSYVGYLSSHDETSSAASNTLYARLLGDMSMTANFDAASGAQVDGRIENRSLEAPADDSSNINSVDDLILVVTALNSDGSYRGTTSGGDIESISSGGIDGAYGGLISGDTGQETIGAVRLIHDTGSEKYIEIGVFIAQ